MKSAIGSPFSRWPNVPACYGWVTLDPRGRWGLGPDGGELVEHPGLVAFLNQNYASTEGGEWFIQNGPQRAFVTLMRAPYILRIDERGELRTHTGLPVRAVTEALVDDEGNAYLVCEHGLAGIDDRELRAMIESAGTDGQGHEAIILRLGEQSLPLVAQVAGTLPEHFGVVMKPVSGSACVK